MQLQLFTEANPKTKNKQLFSDSKRPRKIIVEKWLQWTQIASVNLKWARGTRSGCVQCNYSTFQRNPTTQDLTCDCIQRNSTAEKVWAVPQSRAVWNQIPSHKKEENDFRKSYASEEGSCTSFEAGLKSAAVAISFCFPAKSTKVAIVPGGGGLECALQNSKYRTRKKSDCHSENRSTHSEFLKVGRSKKKKKYTKNEKRPERQN